MSLAKLEIEWKDASDEHVVCVPLTKVGWTENKLGNPVVSRPITPVASPGHCPHCQSIIYSRKAKLCGVCSGPIPENIRFGQTETKRIQSLMDIERNKHRKWISKELKQTLAVL